MKIIKKADIVDKWNGIVSQFSKKLDFFEKEEFFQKKTLLLGSIILFCSISFYAVLKNDTTGDIDLIRGSEDKYIERNSSSPKVIQVKDMGTGYVNKEASVASFSDDS